MAINLGDVNFGVGADLTNLQRSVRQLQAFSRQVDAAQGAVDGLGAALRRQEKAAGDAFIKVQNMTSAMNRVRGSSQYIDQANAAYARFNQTMTSGRLSTLEMQRAQERLRVSLANTQNGFRDFTAESRRASAGANGLVDSLRNLQASAVILTGPLGGIATRISAFTHITKAAGFSFAAFAAGTVAMAAGIVKLGIEANRAGANMKGWESGLKAVTGSQQEAAKEIAYATKVANDAGTNLTSTINAYTKFTAAAEGTALQGAKARDVFDSMAKAATILNLGTEATEGSFKALEQMISKGTVQAEELRGQLGDRLPGAFQIAARAMGVSTAKLGELMKKGLVPTTEFLPKFAAELRKTFNIPSGPIDTYAAAIGRMQTAYERLMISIDQKFDITGKVQAAANAIAQGLDWVRENLDKVVAGAALAGSALLTALMPPIGLPALIAAVNKFGDQFQVIAGEAGTFKDYMNIVWEDIKAGAQSAGTGISDPIKQGIDNFVKNIPQLQADLSTLWEGFIENLQKVQTAIDTFLNGLINGMQAAWNGMAALWPMLPAAIADGVISAMNGMISAVNSGLQAVAGAVNSVISGISAVKTAMGGAAIDFKVNLNIPEIENAYAGAGSKAGQAFDKAWADTIQNPKDYMSAVNKGLDEVNKQVIEYGKNTRERANAEAYARNYVTDQINQAKELNKLSAERTASAEREKRLKETMARFGSGGDGGGSGKGSSKAAKALERRQQAIKDIEEAIKRADEEIAAIGGGEAGIKRLNEEFKRRDEVEKYAKALRKAGVDAEYIKTKTDELYNKLKERDALKQAQQGLEEWSNTMSQSVDWFGESLVDLAFEGKDAFKSIGDAAKNLAKDLVNTFVQLSLTNPLKNLLFGQNNATMPTVGGGGGGWLSGLGNLFGGLFGKSAFPSAPGGLYRKGGVNPYGFGNYQRAANGLVTKPTFFDTPSGVVQAGEAGTEAIMPLERDSSGSLGVRANVDTGTTNVVVNVYAPEGSKVSKKQSQNQNGDSIIDVFIEQAKQAVATDIAQGGGVVGKAISGRFGIAESGGLSKK